jgi:hypothetical protein
MKKTIIFITPIVFIFSFFILINNKPSYNEKLLYCMDSIKDAKLQNECLSNLLFSSLESNQYLKLTEKIESSYKKGVIDKNFYKSCHSISHKIGASLVTKFQKNKDIINNIFTNNCEQGLAHGFFENISKSNNVNFLVELLNSCNTLDNYLGCAHGYGHYLSNNYPNDDNFIKCNNFENIIFIAQFKYECGYGLAMSLWSPVDLLGNSIDSNKNNLLKENINNNILFAICNKINDISIKTGCSAGLGFSYKEYLTISSYQEAYDNIKKENFNDQKSFLEFYITLPNYKIIDNEIFDELLKNICINNKDCIKNYINFIKDNISNSLLDNFCSKNKLLDCNKDKRNVTINYDNNAYKYFKICNKLSENSKGCENQLFTNFKDLYYINDIQYKQICNDLALKSKEMLYCNKVLFE